MKIKLVTFAPHPNFGTCLQSYALNKVLRDMGHDVEFIYNAREKRPKNYLKNFIKKIVKFIIPKAVINRYKAKQHIDIINEEPYIITLPNNKFYFFISQLPFYKALYKKIKCRNLQWKKVYKFTFEDGNYKMKRLFVKKQYDEIVSEANIFITGSDQIWNPYCGGFNPMMFLEFVQGKRKCVAYSSSISRPYLPDSLKDRIKHNLTYFQHIAVREQKSVELLTELLQRNDIKLVVDPTYLLSAKEWSDFGKKAQIEFEVPDKYIFCYFVGGERYDFYQKMVADVKHFTGINDVITLECYNRPLNYGNGRLYNDAGPYEWVYLLEHASYVCMDSFHATVFALKFNKNFCHALKNEENNSVDSQNTRMFDMLGRYGLLNKIYDGKSDSWKMSVDFESVGKIIEDEIKDSVDFLKYEIEGGKDDI